MTDKYEGVQHISTKGDNGWETLGYVRRSLAAAGIHATTSAMPGFAFYLLGHEVRCYVLTPIIYPYVFGRMELELPAWLKQTTLSREYYNRYFEEYQKEVLIMFIDHERHFDASALRLIAKVIGQNIGAEFIPNEGETQISCLDIFNERIDPEGCIPLTRLEEVLLTGGLN